MPGPFAHLALAAVTGAELEEGGSPWFYFGAIASDYPYYSRLGNPAQLAWADLCHTTKVGEKFGVGLDALRREPDNKNLRAWLLGYAIHPVVDAIIHPVVNLAVGPYEQNKKKHRLCEWSQDIYLFGRYLGEKALLPLLASLALCAPKEKMDETILPVWRTMLAAAHPHHFGEHPPAIKQWHEAFLSRLQTFLSQSKMPAEERIAALYGDSGESRSDAQKYIENLATPQGGMISYAELFEKALAEVRVMTKRIGALMDEGRFQKPFGAWNIDSGGLEGEAIDVTSGNAKKLLYWRP